MTKNLEVALWFPHSNQAVVRPQTARSSLRATKATDGTCVIEWVFLHERKFHRVRGVGQHPEDALNAAALVAERIYQSLQGGADDA